MEPQINLLETQGVISASPFCGSCPSGFLFAHWLRYVALVFIIP